MLNQNYLYSSALEVHIFLYRLDLANRRSHDIPHKSDGWVSHLTRICHLHGRLSSSLDRLLIVESRIHQLHGHHGRWCSPTARLTASASGL